MTEYMEIDQPHQSTGSLRTKISLKHGVRRVCPFHLMKETLPPPNNLLGSKDLISLFDLGSSYQKYCTPGKLRNDLASFLPQLCNTQKLTSSISSSPSLCGLIEKPPITGKQIVAPHDMKGFQLVPGTVPEAYQLFDTKDVNRLIGIGSNGAANTADDQSNAYDEFGNNFGDSFDQKKAHRAVQKRALENPDFAEGERKAKKHKKDKKKSKKEKKRDKERKEGNDEGGTPGSSRPTGISFY
uniref:Mediator of RNA polymerase II transcription subunit 19 n=1 Tax=Panagrellus redivivus TaxID=6233 RepID=A0A7E4UQJ5_PANRE